MLYYDVANGSFNYSPNHDKQAFSDYSSYAFNGGNARHKFKRSRHRRSEHQFDKRPNQICPRSESSAFTPWSWHKPKKPLSPAKCIFSDP